MEFYQEDDNRVLQDVIHWIVDVVVIIVLALFFVHSYGSQITLSGQSMAPALAGGETVLVDQLSYHFIRPKRFEIIVFQKEGAPKTYIKRIIGLPGETIQIKNGRIYIDEQPLLGEEALLAVSLGGLAEQPVTLGEDEYFVLGDNRDSSEDSRFANIGNVKLKDIQGKVWFRIQPLEKIGFITTKN